jgi:hypothetical protein
VCRISRNELKPHFVEIEFFLDAQDWGSVGSKFVKEAPVSGHWVEDCVERIALKIKVFSFPPLPNPQFLSEWLATWHGF